MLSISEEEVEDAVLSKAVSEEWNAAMEELFAPAGPLQKMLRRQARAGQSLRWLTRVVSMVLAQPNHMERSGAGGQRGVPDARAFVHAADTVAVSIKPTMLNGTCGATSAIMVWASSGEAGLPYSSTSGQSVSSINHHFTCTCRWVVACKIDVIVPCAV